MLLTTSACVAPAFTTAATHPTVNPVSGNPVTTSVPQVPPPADHNNWCEGGVIDSRRMRIPELPKPEAHVRYTDPALGATVVRITQSDFGEVRKPAYSTMQAWNADESLLLLYRSDNNGSGHELRDGHTYKLIRYLNFLPADIEEVFWSHNNPDELFYISAEKSNFGQFRRLNPHTNTSALIADFSAWCGAALPVAGSDVHMQSHDDDLFGFRCQNDNNDSIIFSYRISSNEVLDQPAGTRAVLTAPTPAPSGKRFWYQGKTLDTTLESTLLALDLHSYSEHSNIGITTKGQDALYQVAFDPSPEHCGGDALKGVGHLVEHNLETGACRNIISQQQGYPYPTSSTHISAQAYRRPGHIALSSIGTREQTRYFTNGKPAPALFSEVYLADTNPGTPTVCRLAHHRSYGKNAINGGYTPYFGEPHATISPSGTRIIFGSDWYDSGSVDTYVIELPDYKKP